MSRQGVAYFAATSTPERRKNSSTIRGRTPAQFHPSSPIDFEDDSESDINHRNRSNSFRNGTSGTSFAGGDQTPLQHHATIIHQSPLTPRITTTTIPITSTTQKPATVHLQILPPQNGIPSSSGQQIIIASQPLQTTQALTADGTRVAFVDYIVEQKPTICTTNGLSSIQYQTPIGTRFIMRGKMTEAQRAEKEAIKKAKQAESARLRYHRLSPEEKKALNLKRTLAQKRKRQREKELAELEVILRATNDIVDDPDVTEQLREKRLRAKWAEAARVRYQRMSSEERKSFNNKRRSRQVSIKNEKGEVIKDEDTIKKRLKEQNAKKAEAARMRYHRMSSEEKKLYNQRRTEAFRRRRMEEEALLAMPIGRINGEALDRAQQIVVRNAKRAEAARLRYQRMSPEQRRAYNQKRYMPKRKKLDHQHQLIDDAILMDVESIDDDPSELLAQNKSTSKHGQEPDALTSLERDVIRRTHQAQQALLKQRTANIVSVTDDVVSSSASPTPTSQIIHQPRSHLQIQHGQPTSTQQIVLQQHHFADSI